MITAGIVFNAIMHCPTGQAEGIDSAVNFLIRRQQIASTDALAMIGQKVIASAVQKAFFTTFHNGGGVHGISRARLVLSKELGLHHAVAGFKEQLSRVSDSEIPQIFDRYYAVFNLKYLLDEARRNMPNRYEEVVLGNAHVDRAHATAAQMIKTNKPVMLGSIIRYLHDHDVSEEAMHDVDTGFGIAEDFQAISDAGLLRVLVRMGFLHTAAALPVIQRDFNHRPE
jgi:hypothetical protein